MKEIFYLMEPDGAFGRIPFELPQAEELYVNLVRQILFVGNDRLLICDDQGIFYLVNVADGSVVRTFEFGNSENMYVAFAMGKMLLFQSISEVLLYDSETGEQQSPGEAMQNGFTESGMIRAADTLDAGESIYYVTEQGI